MKRFALALVVSVGLALPSLVSAASYDIDGAHSSVTFSVKHMMMTNVRGEFQKVSGTIEWDEKNPKATVIKVAIDPASISTRDEKRDGHLKSDDFFAVAKYPALTFESTKVEVVGKGKLKITGKLTMRGVTKDVVLDAEGPSAEITDPWGNVKVGASATATVNRQDFGIMWNAKLDKGGVVVGDDVKITIDIEAIKKIAK